jgi:hypothetical protein
MNTKLTNTQRLVPVVFTVTLVFLAAVAGATALDLSYGTSANWISAEINGMGATGVALDRGGFGAALNPATLAWAEDWRVDAGGSFSEVHEDRFQPLFDSFSSYVTDTAIASNRSHRFGTGFAVSKGFGERIGAGLSLTTRHGFGYEFNEDVRDPNSFADPRDQILQERSLTYKGNLRDLGLGAAFEISPQVHLGAALHYVFGEVEAEELDRFFLTEASSYLETDTWNPNGLSVTTGMTFTPNERLVIGAAWDLPFDMGGDELLVRTEGAGDPTGIEHHTTVRYPQRARIGFALHPRTEPLTVFSAEVEWTEWSQLQDNRIDDPNTMENTMDYKVGVQHTFYNGMPIRFGFRHLDHYSDPEAMSSIFSMGLGAPFAEGMINVSTELGKVSFVQGHFFDYPEGYTVRPTARVEETLFRLGATFTYRF